MSSLNVEDSEPEVEFENTDPREGGSYSILPTGSAAAPSAPDEPFFGVSRPQAMPVEPVTWWDEWDRPRQPEWPDMRFIEAGLHQKDSELIIPTFFNCH